MKNHFEQQLQTISEDRQQGAAQLARMGMEALFEWVQSWQGERRDFRGEIENALQRLAELRPAMAPIANWIFAYKQRLHRVLKEHPNCEPKPLALQVGRDILAEQRSILKKQIEAARPSLQPFKRLMTLSYSSTVEALLREAAPNAELIISESRPLYEGRRLTQILLDQGRSVTLITEAQMALFIQKADAVLIGADTIAADLAIINKVGTHTLCILAHQANIPVFVAADTYKFRSDTKGTEIESETHDGAQIWPEHPELCANIIFESTPAHLIGHFITEHGVLTPTEMGQALRNRHRL